MTRAEERRCDIVGAFSVIVQPVVEPMEHYTALVIMMMIASAGSGNLVT